MEYDFLITEVTMSDTLFEQLTAQVTVLPYEQKVKLLDFIVQSLHAPVKKNGMTEKECRLFRKFSACLDQRSIDERAEFYSYLDERYGN
jgi:hypothetical protein